MLANRRVICVFFVFWWTSAMPVPASILETRHQFARPVGHGGIEYFNPAAKRFSGEVVAIGRADAKGRVSSFRMVPSGPGASAPAVNSMAGWRLTFLAGKRYSSAFEVRSNTADEIVVVPRGGTLKGIAAKDIFVVDEPDPKSPWADDLRFDVSH